MKKLVFVLFLVLSNFAYAQNYYVSNIAELTNDLAARRKPVTDENGKGCALVRVNIPSVNGISFESSIVGKPEFLPGEYNVYLRANSKSLSFTVDGNKYDVDFSKFNITLEDKKCYRVVLKKRSPNSPQKTRTTIDANYDNVVVMIDGKPVGQTPLVINNITPGKHVISIPNTFGVTMSDQTVNISANNDIKLTLHKEPRKCVRIEVVGGGGDGFQAINTFGTNIKEVNGKKGLVDYTGNVLVPCEFDYVYPVIQNGYYKVSKNEKSGLYETGKGLVVPCIYDRIETYKSHTHKDYMRVCNDGKWAVMSPNGKIAVSVEYEGYLSGPKLYKDVIVVPEYKKLKHDNVYGLISYTGNIIKEPQYDFIGTFVNGYAFFKKMDGSIGFIDANGKETVIPSKYGVGSFLDNNIFKNGLFKVRNKDTGKWGYINTNLELVIPAIYDVSDYDETLNFNKGIVMLKLNDNKVVLNTRGKIVLDCKANGYKDIQIVCQEDDDYYLNKGKFTDYRYSFENDDNTFIKVINTKDQCGFLDVNGNTVIPCRYNEDDIKWFTDNNKDYFVLTEGEQILVKDDKQNLLFSLPSNLSVSEITDGFVMIRDEESGSYGYLNMKGEVIANCIYGYKSDTTEKISEEYDGEGYDMVDIINDEPISEGLAILNIGDRFGFIDNKGNIKVPLKYTAVTPFDGGVSFARQQNGKWIKIYKKDL